jgi:hypothetical protein
MQLGPGGPASFLLVGAHRGYQQMKPACLP